MKAAILSSYCDYNFNNSSIYYNYSAMSLLNMPSHYSKTMKWEEEQAMIFHQILGVDEKISAQGVIDRMMRHGIPIRPNHEHYKKALQYIEGHIIPDTVREFLKSHHMCDWDILGEIILLTLRMCKLVKPSEFQVMLGSIQAYEYGVDICPDCGLTEGPWCGEWLFFFFYYLMLIYLLEEEEDSDFLMSSGEGDQWAVSGEAWGSPVPEDSEWEEVCASQADDQ